MLSIFSWTCWPSVCLIGKTSIQIYPFFQTLIYLFIYFWLRWVFVAACRLSLVAASGGLLFVAVRGLLIEVASLVAEHGLWVHGLQLLWCSGSVVVARGL